MRAVTCREDQARASARNSPQALAAFRDTVLRRVGFKPVEGFEHFVVHLQQAIKRPSKTWGVEARPGGAEDTGIQGAMAYPLCSPPGFGRSHATKKYRSLGPTGALHSPAGPGPEYSKD